ncbi:glycosyltransferase family 39 protein [Hymenobacter ruber]
MAGLFFGLLVLLGGALHRDYGMGWDEPAERLNAFVSAKYIALKLAPELARRQPRLADIPDLRQHRDADHGVLFMLPWVGLEALRPGPDPAEWAYRRHLAGFLLFVAGAWAVYRLGRARLASWRWGLVGAGLLVLSPRIFAEAFYNYKDIVFLSLFALAILTLTRLLRRPTAGRMLLHALATAAAIDVRTMGILLPLLTLAFGVLEMWARPIRRRGLAGALALYLPTMVVLVVLAWPYLWENPWENFRAALSSFGHYAKPLEVFYLGQFVPIQALPWHYAPVWLLITTPVPYALLFVVGVVGVGRDLWRRGPERWLRRTGSRRDLLVLAWFVGPLLGVMLLHSAIYDGWRHLYFVYPAFLLLAVQGLRLVWRQWQQGPRAGAWAAGAARLVWRQWQQGPRAGAWAAGAALLAVALGTAQVAWRMATEHPFQYVYFSFLPGHVIEQNFERDYWGLSVKQGLQWVLAHDARPAVPVSMDSRTEMTLRINAKMLPPAARARLRIVPPDSAAGGYFLSIHRWHPGPYPARAGQPGYAIRVGGAVILRVLRRP